MTAPLTERRPRSTPALRAPRIESAGGVSAHEINPAERAALAPSSCWVREGQTYGLCCDGAERLAVGADVLEPMWPGLFSWTVRNAVGRASIRAMSEGRAASRALEVEVVAKRFEGPSQQLAFVRAMVAAIEREQRLDPFRDRHFEWGAARDGAIDANALIDALTRDADALRSALAAVGAVPATALVELVERVTVAQDPASIDAMDVASASGPWQSAAHHSTAAGRLRGRAPREAWGAVARTTFDCAENRWLRRSLETALAVAEGAAFEVALSTRAPVERKRASATLDELRAALEREPLASAGDAHDDDPARARAMCDRREQYASAARWLDGAGATSTLRWPAARAAASLRDAATLYEMYCFFALARAVGAAVGAPLRFVAARHQRPASSGLARGAEVLIGEEYRLLYNRDVVAYSGTLRPDFALFRGAKLDLVFDAKMRASDGDEAARTDIDKMHTYRDALGARAAVCLFPGERSVLFDVTSKRQGVARVASIVRGAFEGVGALALAPEGAL